MMIVEKALLDKQEAYHLWSRNHSHLTGNNFVRLRIKAQSVYASAERDCSAIIKGTLYGSDQPHKWWTTLTSPFFAIDSSVPLLVKPDDCITHYPLEKETLFADGFDSKHSNEKLEFPPSCLPMPKLSGFVFQSSEVKILLLDLNSFGVVDPNGIFPLCL